ncbi:peptidoglycan DD-metalloendopeptidase family protein [Heyndrickxia sporothermodurans]|uniref:Peptidoglycan DD-metalloendopeptidase family protein n=1 Tax=Heyndrickxia sporothermodurans TaxID=46224 RepID=A0AB37HEZ2_9BACI|nr:peptidoglycan DD-metalloendopeptidase family protein [Heyndrickxia sporothermodurans]MBL5768932.1 peptidoglycan DD-metalloendopeptidase family protein [Heyndrickxia sporothermodurans]MBL5772694.1 peptidoglycan DD-metalloendopeptidase family protein [Heyndrickxia sporothermodurans]MBL5776201.1 peptidoglycan DD-metalloendopeptidase family protein [Heyndrickxia sporothermodurans]MBL5783313.1 peptidoglycan DD-metalloendopeptidase family protein [Heyndrickxia sporothermodurans]MBL5786813.1 pepti
MKKKSLLSVTLASVLGFGGLFAYQSDAFASKLSNLQDQQKDVQNKQSNIHSNIKQKENKIDEIKGKQNNLESELETLDVNIADTDEKIQEKQQQIDVAKREIEKLKSEINALKKRIKERNELLDKRARTMQTNGGGSVNYLDVILGADSIADLLDRVSAVTTLVNADKQIIDEQKRDQAELEKKQADVTKKLNNLQEMQQKLQAMKAELNQQKSRKNVILKELGKQKKKLEHDKMSLEEENAILSAQKSAIEKAIQLEKDRIAEEQRAAAEAAAAQKQQSSYSTNGSGNSGNSSNSVNSVSSGGGKSSGTPAVSSGTFTRPAQGYVSSEFGRRSFDADGFHSGIDIAKGGTVPIVAAGDGVVTRSYFSSSYGNCIFITHSVNGKIYTTVYAHMSSRTIGENATVRKGQVIGYMGSTGQAYGQHLHFEFYIGPWTASHSNAVNPRNYINF